MITVLTSPDELLRDEITLSGNAYRHLFRARRLAAGARLRAVDGEGGARWSEVTRIGRETAVLALGEPAEPNEPRYGLDLVVAALRGERASWLVEKATEIGVRAVRFLGCERTPRKYGRASLERLRRVAAAALMQCHRARLPEISGVDPWRRLPELLAGVDERYVLDPGAARGRDVGKGRPGASGVVVIGPEGGWSGSEREALASLGCAAIDLGPRILRTETAALAIASRLLLDQARGR